MPTDLKCLHTGIWCFPKLFASLSAMLSPKQPTDGASQFGPSLRCPSLKPCSTGGTAELQHLGCLEPPAPGRWKLMLRRTTLVQVGTYCCWLLTALPVETRIVMQLAVPFGSRPLVTCPCPAHVFPLSPGRYYFEVHAGNAANTASFGTTSAKSDQLIVGAKLPASAWQCHGQETAALLPQPMQCPQWPHCNWCVQVVCNLVCCVGSIVQAPLVLPRQRPPILSANS